jgi:glycosyltransferase involved in cell wall biosynthesis
MGYQLGQRHQAADEMRIAWFSPLSTKSAIGRFTVAVTDELSRFDEVVIWHPHCADPLQSGCRTVEYRSSDQIGPGDLAGYDIVIYNLGNYCPFHLEIYKLVRRYPGIVIAHDFVMHHFFASYLLEQQLNTDRYLKIMSWHYGIKGEMRARAYLRGEQPAIWETDEVSAYPLFEEATIGASGLIVHSRFFLERAIQVVACPVERLHLAYPVSSGFPLKSRKELGLPEDKVIACSVGHVNPNRRIHVVLQALASDRSLRERLHYVVAGPQSAHYAHELRELIHRHGLHASVELWGYVDDVALQSLISHSDFCIVPPPISWTVF